MFKTTLATAAIAIGAVGLSGCDVKKTQEGHAQLPKYDVEKKQSADVKLPKYDVTGPDVKVGSKEKTLNVPNVDVHSEKKTLNVPSVEVKTAKEKEQEQAQKNMGASGTSQ
jgi:hypothetical protein